MKKIAALLMALVLCLLITAGQVWADTDGTSTLILKENSEVYELNGKELEFEKPFMKQDTLMSCLDPIIKTMNITFEKSTDGKSITLKYGGSTIVMHIGSKDATVDGIKTTISQAPVSVNGSIMVPLRFVVENFGGEVSVASDTGYITVIKETAGDNSIKDFSLLLKKTTKEIVGDSYYNWSMRLPKDVKISYRSFNGSYNTFEAIDESYTISLSVYDQGADETFETLVESELQYASEYTLISQEKSTRNGLDYFKIVYKDDEAIYEERNFIKDNKVYELSLVIEDADKYKNNKELTAILDSFIPEFKNDSSTEDLSDIAADGRRIYEDKKLKFSARIPADWYKYDYGRKENQVTFTSPYKGPSTNSDSFTISMYSLENEFSLDKWNERELQYIENEYNPELVKILETEDITINSTKAKKIVCSTKLNSKTTYSYNIFIAGERYRYELNYLTNKSYNNAIVQSSINSLLGTFNFSEPDPEELGSFLDPDSIIKSEGVRFVDNKANGFSFEVPVNWSKAPSSDNYAEYYTNSDSYMGVIIIAKKGVSEQEYNKQIDDSLKQAASVADTLTYNGKQIITDKGVRITKYDISMIQGELTNNMCSYIFSKNGTTYEVGLFLQDLRASEKNKKLLSDIWDSLKFK
ncbi:MAG: hypothetical protein APF77_01560 [Clostridia bacterium BRH_c25]|nr:MAG: hypothetical protein APF77_01560 [Clostridia bacterium BRH_c25]